MRTILILEDDEMLRVTLAEELTDVGFTVYDARTAEDAIRLFDAHPEISAVISDVTLKGEQAGLTFCDSVRSSRPDCRIVITSGERSRPGGYPAASSSRSRIRRRK